MTKLLSLFFLSLALLPGCGKFLDKFSRIDNSYTRVYLSNRSQEQNASVLPGGLMVYFISEDTTEMGRAFGFANETTVNSQPVVLPNGNYRVYAYAWDGTNPLEGQVRCGKGDLGAIITLAGVATTVSIDMNKATCGFGSANEFGFANAADDPSPLSNFDSMNLQLCTGSAYPSCTAATGSTFYVKTQLLGGIKPAGSPFLEVANYSLTSACSSGGSGTIATNFRLPVGGTRFSPPVRINFYTDSSCTSAATGTYSILDGLKSFMSVSSGSNTYLDMPASSSNYYLRLYQNF